MELLEQELKRERTAVRSIESMHMKTQRTGTYVALDDIDFIWNLKDVLAIEHMWRERLSLEDIANAFQRDPDDVAVLIMDRARKDKVGARKNGVFGNRKPR